jgi:hypothetical protein
LRDLLPLLDQSPAAVQQPAPERPPQLGLGMNCGDMLTADAGLAYANLAEDHLQLLVLQALERGLAADLDPRLG